MTDEPRNPQRVRCNGCGHEWIGFYLPMEAMTAAKLVKGMCCPNCGANAKHIYLAPDPTPNPEAPPA